MKGPCFRLDIPGVKAAPTTTKKGASMAKDDLVERVPRRTPACAKVGVFDVDGIFRGKYMAPDKLASALDGGFGFCDVVLGWDSSDQLYDNASFTGWHTAYPDAEGRLL